MRKYHQDMTLPQKNEIFVFGSNLAGRHGAGAARVALQYGARFGVGVGISKMTYAIPTKNVFLRTLSLKTIQQYVDEFVRLTRVTDCQWFVTRIGCGLARYQDSEIAPMFKLARNCSFAKEWKPFLLGPSNEHTSP